MWWFLLAMFIFGVFNALFMLVQKHFSDLTAAAQAEDRVVILGAGGAALVFTVLIMIVRMGGTIAGAGFSVLLLRQLGWI